MSAIYDPQSFHSDGTPRRKYEIDEAEPKRLALSAVVGLIAVNIVVLVKNVLFGSATKNSWADEPSQTPERHGTVIDDSQDSGVRFSGSDEPDENEEPLGDGKYGAFRSASFNGGGGAGMAGASYGSQVPLQLTAGANDNELLYGTRPGTIVIDFGRDDDDVIGGGGGGGGGDIDVPPDTDTDPDDDRDDEDDDDDTPPRPNRAPVVSGPVVLAGLLANTSVVIAFADLLRNASDPDGDALSVVNVRASSGKLQILPDGRGWIFTPDANDASGVTFTYSVSDGKDRTAQTAELDLLPPDGTIIVGTSGDDRIVGTMEDDVIDALCGDDVVIGRAGDDVIYGGCGNDRIFGEDGDDLIYAGAGNDFVSGGRGNDTVFGGTGCDILFGDDGDDILHGDEGDDVISGGYGNDIAFGGSGSDRLSGEQGNDILDGGDGDDDLDGGYDDDTLTGSRGADKIHGGKGSDVIRATIGDGDDTIDGGSGTDVYDTTATSAPMYVDLSAGTAHSSETGHDQLTSIESVRTGAGADRVIGSSASNAIHTNAGDDQVNAAKGDDTVDTGAGDDAILASAGDGNDAYDGGSGEDVYDLSSIHEDVVVDLKAGSATGQSIGTDAIVAIENVIAGSGDDTIRGDDQANVIIGGAGSDVVDAGCGDDTVIASVNDGDDDYSGGGGSDVYDLSGTVADAIVDLAAGFAESSETGHDTLTEFENVTGGDGDDTITGNECANVLTGGGGQDAIDAGSGDDVLIAAVDDGDDEYAGGEGYDTYDLSGTSADAIVDLLAGLAQSAETGSDTLFGVENVTGSSGNDILIANDERNIFTGGDGDDLFVFRTTASIGKGHGSRDKILDFSVGDRIDIRDIGDDIFRDLQNALDDPVMRRFVMIGHQDLFERPGQMRLSFDEFEDETITILQGNVDDDADADFEIELSGYHDLQYEDFRH